MMGRHPSLCLTIASVVLGCRPYAPEEPVSQTSSACCTVADDALQVFSGCRVARGYCRHREPVWLTGRIACGPVDEESCDGGRCCSYVVPESSPDEDGESESTKAPEGTAPDAPSSSPASSTP